MIDPTLKAKQHYMDIINFYKFNKLFTGNIQSDLYKCISGCKPDLDKMSFIELGLWNKKDTLRFFKQDNHNYVSQSLIEGVFGLSFDEVNVDSVKGIMNMFGHSHIDLIKLDIEGAECVVLEQMLDDGILPKYILVEFDLLRMRKDVDKSTEKIIRRLLDYGYKILANESMNITFSRT